jgi:alpha,alpha-trehalose-phosphate synthase [UDP-forming]
MRLVSVSNRLPVVIEKHDDELQIHSGSGGLITAIGPVLRTWGGLWIGWPGTVVEDNCDTTGLLSDFSRTAGYELQAVPLTVQERDNFYHGFTNEIVWPLFHDLQSFCNFEPIYWQTYRQVNCKFAEVVRENTQPEDAIWVHDYHLMGLGRELRSCGVTSRLIFFLHIPFPPPDIFCKLPWRTDVLEGLLAYDLIGFQTPRDRDNFKQCLCVLLPGVRFGREPGHRTVTYKGGRTKFGAFPISIDFDEFAERSSRPEVADLVQSIHRELPDRTIILGVDRLDYTKGIPDRLRAFRVALQRYPELHRKVTFAQVVVPSREGVPQYRELKGEIERLVSEINGQFTQTGWVPIHHVFRSFEHNELLAYYRAATVGLITPLKDGMNLVSKEFCACQADNDAVLILSEFAGSAAQLHPGALLVNPYDLEGVARMIHRAVTMERGERRTRMRRLRRLIRKQDIYWWMKSFLGAAGIGEES